MSRVEEITSSLISFQTVAPKGDEYECAKYILDYLNDLKIEDSEIDFHEFDQSRANVVATFGGTKESGLLLSGHMDVVAPGNRESWHSDPFQAKVVEGKLFGRGASDMKGGLASILEAVRNIVKTNALKRKLVFVATAGEETGFVGLTKLIQNAIVDSRTATCAVIGEPTDLKPARAHRGIYRLKVEFLGKSSHASTPELGVNAIEYASRFVESLGSIRAELSQQKDDLLGATSLTPTMINGGIGENVIPPSTELILDSRRLPVHSSEYIRSKIEEKCKDLKVGYRIAEIVNHKPLDTPEGNFITKLAEKIAGEHSLSAFFGTEGSLYWGDLGIPTMIIGPGSVKQAHVDNEFVELSQLERAISIYSSFIREICL